MDLISGVRSFDRQLVEPLPVMRRSIAKIAEWCSALEFAAATGLKFCPSFLDKKVKFADC